MGLITIIKYVNVQAGKTAFESTLLLLISTGVGKIDLYKIFTSLYKYIYVVRKIKGVSVRIQYQYEDIKITKLLVASIKSILLC